MERVVDDPNPNIPLRYSARLLAHDPILRRRIMEEEIRNFLAWLAKAHGVVIDEMFVDEYMDSKE